eukprot:TRINITY_DN65218_c0_g1_i1.p1 TRINITY_DN65218_c0_g1~~TRINITY_DN65218_c0_g1_i1.p1  ORF type:complete len:247 (+),score=51.09 TRINITY_DN65218_c0_g1_i1:211-951(+)
MYLQPAAIKDTDAAGTLIMSFFERENRPYSPQDCINLSQGKLKKAAVEKALSALVEKGELTEKVIKSTRAYMANQSNFEVHDDETKEKLETEIAELTEEAKELDTELKSLTGNVNRLNAQLTDEELKKEIKRLKESTAEKEKKLEKLQGGAVLITEEDRENAIYKYCTARSLWRKRKALCNELIDAMCGDAKHPRELREEVGIETDEERGFLLAESDLGVTPKPKPKPAKVQKTAKTSSVKSAKKK